MFFVLMLSTAVPKLGYIYSSDYMEDLLGVRENNISNGRIHKKCLTKKVYEIEESFEFVASE